MRATVVYESMYGNTRRIAEAIAEGLGADATALPVAQARDQAGAPLLVVGGPTHAWSMSRRSTRQAAAEAAARPDSGLTMEPQADGTGVREFLQAVVANGRQAAAFDTRSHSPFSGRASAAIKRALSRRGFVVIDSPHSFFVKKNVLVDGELDRARAWGRTLAQQMEGRHRAGSSAG